LNALVRAAGDRLDDAAQLHRDARTAHVDRLIAHINVSRQAAVRRKHVRFGALAELRGVFRRLARCRRLRARLGELVAQRTALLMQFRELLAYFFHITEFVGFEQRHELLDRDRHMV